MKKKPKARELREANKQKRLDIIKSKPAEPVTAAAPQTDETIAPVSDTPKIKNKKTASKIAGLKSRLVVGNDVYMTSFGNGNEAVIEQKIATSDAFKITSIPDEPSLNVTSADEIKFSFSSKRPFVENKNLSVTNPLHSNPEAKKNKAVGGDMLGLKDELEKRYFGKTFDDNIHIQIIHNILDIEKIIAVYATNISAALNHLIDGDDEKLLGEDFIGYMNTQNTYEVFMDTSKNPKLSEGAVKNIKNTRAKFETLLGTQRLGYFGFEYDGKDEDVKKRIYHLIAFAGQLRQWSFHSYEGFPRTWLYNLEKLNGEYLYTLDYYFDKRFKDINKNFVSQNNVNLYILKETFPDCDFRKLADLYHDFIVVKLYKNMGFSIKKLREKMLELDSASRIKGTDMDSVRPKLYKLIDFCIFYDFFNDNDRSEDMVNRLRAATSDERKEMIYANEATYLWNKLGRTFLNFCDKISSWVKNDHTKEIETYIDKDAYRISIKVSYFSKLLYAMCFFLDGKEINDLLTTLINKFDNIRSFIDTAKWLGLDVTFIKGYTFFNASKSYVDELNIKSLRFQKQEKNQSKSYVDELNIIKNIARMQKPSAKTKRTMYCDALTILGLPVSMGNDELEKELDDMVNKEIDPRTNKPKKGSTPFRNFINNNVIENRRFIYVIKFCNPKNVRKLVNNTKVTEFVLRRMPEEQIDRYYRSCFDTELNPMTEIKIQKLAQKMKDMDFTDFRDVQQKSRDSEKNKEKERFKAVIGLYLTVVYRLVKNLADVNARYVMAFHSLERDSSLYNEPVVWKESGEKRVDYLKLTDMLCTEGDNSRSQYLARNKHARECVTKDIDNAKKWFIGDKFNNNITKYRNNVAHLTAVRRCDEFIDEITKIDSYFALYHYFIQRQLSRKLDPTYPNFEQNYPCYAPLFKYHTYVKDMVKALNSPFGYNVPRFKALTIDDLFDRNEQEKKKSEKLNK